MYDVKLVENSFRKKCHQSEFHSVQNGNNCFVAAIDLQMITLLLRKFANKIDDRCNIQSC